MKRKQIIVLGLVLVIISVGILQYNYGKTGESAKDVGLDNLALTQGTDIEDIPGAAVYVDNTQLSDADDTSEAIAEAEASTGYFAEARMERDKSRSKQKEELRSIVEANSEVITTSSTMTSSEAQEQLLAIIRRSEAETTIETLIKQRGFEDALAYMSDTGNVDIVVKASSLSGKEVAQISDIVVRHANVTMDKITVKNVN